MAVKRQPQRGVVLPPHVDPDAAATTPEDPDAIYAAMDAAPAATTPEPPPTAAPAAPPALRQPPATPALADFSGDRRAIDRPTIVQRSPGDRSSDDRSVEDELEELRRFREQTLRREQGLPQHPRHQDSTKLQAEVDSWAYRALRLLHGKGNVLGMGFGKLVTSVLEDGLRTQDPDLAAKVYATRAKELGVSDDWTRERDPVVLTAATRARLAAWCTASGMHTASDVAEAVMAQWLDSQGVPAWTDKA